MPNTSTTDRTVVGLFDNMDAANKAATQLESAGISRSEISVIAANDSGQFADYTSGTGEVGKGIAGGAGTGAAVGGGLGLLAGLTALAIPGFGPIIAAGPIAAALTGAGVGAATGGLIGGLSNAGVPEDDAKSYSEGVRRGGVLLSVKTSEDLSDDVADILDDNGARDIDEKGREWTAGTTTPGATARTARTDVAGEQSIPVVEEKLKVGKRETTGRAVRVYSTVSERPVEEQVNLRQERIHVERRPVNRAATEADFSAFKEGSIELTERREEAVVGKEARVVEEVIVGKDVDQRTETVRDTVRRTDVRVEDSGASNYDKDYRTDYQTRYASTGRAYEAYEPAYRYGSTYANDARYTSRDWSGVESELRSDWETRGHGKWEDFKDAVRHGWDRVRGRR